jgi:hypothetical protein
MSENYQIFLDPPYPTPVAHGGNPHERLAPLKKGGNKSLKVTLIKGDLAGWFHPKKEKYISLNFSCKTIDFDPSPNLSLCGGEALKLFLWMYETTLLIKEDLGGSPRFRRIPKNFSDILLGIP